MKINGLVTCVNYSDFLARSIDRWMEGLNSLTIVTSMSDTDTHYLAAGRKNVRLAPTDLFYADGAVFNKGRAMEFARKYVMEWSDWGLFFDADVVPPKNWRDSIQDLERGYLYGCARAECKNVIDLNTPIENLPRMPHDVPGVGFFQLFHTEDPVVSRCNLPILETHWTHAGNYDNRFMDRWRKNGERKVRKLPLVLYHLGERDNWWGRGNKAGFQAMQQERAKRGGRWDHEVISAVQPID